MTKKDFVVVAKMIQANLNACDTDASPKVTLRRVASGLASIFKADNSRFNEAKFLEACGFDQ